MVDQYKFSGSLPENATTYVTREADGELYKGLLEGKFCYVLNSRQTGKSSLRVRTMRQLRDNHVKCAAIDFSILGTYEVSLEQWYISIIDTLIKSFKLDVALEDWWWQNQSFAVVKRFTKFLEEILLSQVRENIVIFIDEIDTVLSLEFSADDFFAMIRGCYNSRVDNPEYNRLTFCLLGVASPSNLIKDKTRTPFNIGKAIFLDGFRLHEVEPLKKGLQEKFIDTEAVMEQILYWTGGQPFLTQKLCQLMVEESVQDNRRSVREIVQVCIIENWEFQDNPEHLGTIRDRILRDEQRASHLLELYQQILQTESQSQITLDNTLEQSELQLSGLVVKQENKLRVYNAIYKQIFDQNWIEIQLKNLRPYSESFNFWVASGQTDDSRLLRGKALREAEKWAKDKNNLSYQDKQYLAASKQKEIQEEIATKEQEAALERERKDREATDTRNQALAEVNQTLAKANQKARRRISIGVAVLVLTMVAAAIIGIFSKQQNDVANWDLEQAKQKTKEAHKSEQDAKNRADEALQQAKASKIKNEETKQEVEAVKQLNRLAGELENQKSSTSNSDYNEALRLSALSFNIDNHSLRQALIFAVQSQANQQLINVQFQIDEQHKKLKDAEQEIEESKTNLAKAEADKEQLDFKDYQIQVLFYKIQGRLLVQKKQTQKAIKAYTKAFRILKEYPKETDFTKKQFVTGENITSIYRDLIALLPKNSTDLELRQQVEQSLTKHLYAQLEDYLKVKNWEQADSQTYLLIFNIAKREKERSLDDESIKSFSCPDLRKIDHFWLSNSDNRFGFRVQKEIWIKTGNRLGIKLAQLNPEDYKKYLRFVKAVRWYDDKGRSETTGSGGRFVEYNKLIDSIKSRPSEYKGSLPFSFPFLLFDSVSFWRALLFYSRIATCKV